MKALTLLLAVPLLAVSQEIPPPSVPTAPTSETELKPAPAPVEAESPEDRLETLIDQSVKFYESRQRAKCGGSLLELAELVQDLAQPQPQRVQEEVESLRQLALMAARGELSAHAVDFAASRAYVKLAALCSDRAFAKLENGRLREAGADFYRGVVFAERSIDRGGYGLKDAGIDTLAEARTNAQALAEGQLLESDVIRKSLGATRRMISEIGRSISAKAGTEWQETKDESRSATGVVEDKSREGSDKVKGKLNRFGDKLREWTR